jgi:hypothetical protein
VTITPDHVFTFCMYQNIVDFSTYQLSLGGWLGMDLLQYMGGQPLQLMLLNTQVSPGWVAVGKREEGWAANAGQYAGGARHNALCARDRGRGVHQVLINTHIGLGQCSVVGRPPQLLLLNTQVN